MCCQRRLLSNGEQHCSVDYDNYNCKIYFFFLFCLLIFVLTAVPFFYHVCNYIITTCKVVQLRKDK